eukprot:2754493-Heterocapsa_arctica.AAC.1
MLPTVNTVCWHSLNNLHLFEDLGLRFLYIVAQLLPVEVMLSLSPGGSNMFGRSIYQCIRPIVPNTVDFRNFVRSLNSV